MTPANLLIALKKEIEMAVKNYRLDFENKRYFGQNANEETDDNPDDNLGNEQVEEIPFEPVKVFLQHIPDADFEKQENYPMIIPSIKKINDTDSKLSTAEIDLTIGVFGVESDSWLDLASIMERLRQHFAIRNIIDKKYHIVGPNEWEFEQQQPYPYWFGYGTIKVTMSHLKYTSRDL